MEDRERFHQNLLGLVEALKPQDGLSEFGIMIYERAMQPFADDEIERAMMAAALTMRFFPKPVELVELVKGKTQDRAIVAWEQLLMAVQRYGSYESVLFADGRIARAVELMGGWFQLCATKEDETKWRMADFIKIYQALGESEPKILMGRHEQQNRMRGFLDVIRDPVMIGSNGAGMLQIEAC